MLFYPNAWLSAQCNISCSWNFQSFPPPQRASIPTDPGVYVFLVTPNLFNFESAGGLFYVGKATSLYARISAYISEIDKDFNISKRPYVWRMINQWNGYLQYCYTATANVAQAEELEKEMIKAFRPPFNKQYDAETSQIMRAF